MSVLEARGLTVTFARRGTAPVRAVDDVSLTLESGSTVALVGESGSGKSTVVKALAGLTPITSGSVLLDGQPVRRRPSALRQYRRAVQVVFQDPFASLNPVHSVAHHLARPLRVHRVANRGADLSGAVADLLTSVNLAPAEEIARCHPHELSGGQRQRVAIARALAPRPSVLLADEPVSMLDVSVRLEILNLFADLGEQRHLAMLYVTHDLATARYFSEQVLVMYRGRVVERGPADEVILRPAHPYTRLLASAIPDAGKNREQQAADRAARAEARATRRPTAQAAAGACPFLGRCPHAMPVCADHDPPELTVGPGQMARCWLHAAPAALPAVLS
jgi:peptide/nickel transport system ATP-binding protein